MRLLVAAVGLLIVAAPLHAQMVVTHDTLDVERRDVRDILVVLRDSLHTVEAAAAQLDRGHAAASAELLYSRAMTIKKACARSLRNIGPTREVVKANDWGDEYRTMRQNQVLEAMDVLEESINACQSIWDDLVKPENAEQLRNDGLTEAQSITKAIHDYGAVVAGYYKALGIYVPPAGTS